MSIWGIRPLSLDLLTCLPQKSIIPYIQISVIVMIKFLIVFRVYGITHLDFYIVKLQK